MNARIALGWLRDKLAACWLGEPEDLADWLAGNDQAIDGREQARRRSTVLAAGGEMG